MREELEPLEAQHGLLVSQLLEPNPSEQQWLLLMYQWRQSGWSYGNIANELNRRGVTTKTGGGNAIQYKGAKRLSCGRWQCGNVHKILNSRNTRDWLNKEG